QKGNGARNVARTYQVGDNQQAKQYQDATAGSGAGNEAGIEQGLGSGYYNVATESITQWNNVLNNVDPSAIDIYYSPPSAYNKALQIQVGDDNSAGILQVGGYENGNNYGEQDQNGDRNNAGMIQAYMYGGASNYAKQEQDGDDNTAGLVQQ